LIECKSRRQKYQIQTIAEHLPAGAIPDEYVLQVQTGLLVTQRQWIDFVSYSGGLPMCVIRVLPDLAIQAAIVNAATNAEKQIAEKVAAYEKNSRGLFETERRIETEMWV
jgi:hypothetical protein